MTRKCSLTFSLLLAAVVPILSLGAGMVRADDQERGGAVKLLTTVPIPDMLSPLRAFDISWVDASSQLYYLADRSNASVDVVDARTNQFVKPIQAGFTGVA